MNKGKRIKEARESAGLSKSELARSMGISHTAVGLWERGETKNLKYDNLVALEQITGYSAKWLSTGKGDKLSKNFDLSEAEAELLRKFRRASRSEQEMLLRALKPD